MLKLPDFKPASFASSLAAFTAATAATVAAAFVPTAVMAQTEVGPASTGGAPAAALRAVTVARGLDHPWSIAFLPDFERDGLALVTERPGRLRIVDLRSGALSEPVEGVPAVAARGQGGLLDVALDPRFAENSLVYLSYSESGDGGTGIAVARARLTMSGTSPSPGTSPGARLSDLRVIYRELPKVQGSANLGSRLVFARDGTLFVSVGDRFSLRDAAQDLGKPYGKIMRIDTDGKPARDNPFIGRPGALPEIYSYGHRNPQGMTLDPANGRLWEQEHGPQGGDEVNLVAAGRNYGWPVITYGGEYGSGAKIGEGSAKAGMEQPLVKWVPSIAPSGMAFLTSDRYPGWKGSLFVGALKYQMLVRLTVSGDKVTAEERLLQPLGERIRDVRQSPDGWLYILTDSTQGRVLKLER